MGYVINYDDQANTVYTVVDGKLDVEIGAEFVTHTFEEGKLHQCKKYLFDLRDTMIDESIPNIAQFAMDLEKFGVKTEFYVAVVIKKNPDEHRLFNALSQQRGYSRLRNFTKYSTAQKWLNSL